MNPDSTISAIRPSMSTLVSTTIVRVALGLLVASRPAGGSGPRPRPRRSGRTAWRRSGPSCRGPGTARSRAAARCPAGPRSGPAGGRAAGPAAGRRTGRGSRPRTRRSTAPGPARSASGAGTTVRYGSTAKPTTTQAIVHAASMNPAYGRSDEQAGPGRGAARVRRTRPGPLRGSGCVRITPLLDRSSRAGDGRPRARPSLARGAARRQAAAAPLRTGASRDGGDRVRRARPAAPPRASPRRRPRRPADAVVRPRCATGARSPA